MKTPESREAAQREYDHLRENYGTAITTFGQGGCTDAVDKAAYTEWIGRQLVAHLSRGGLRAAA